MFIKSGSSDLGQVDQSWGEGRKYRLMPNKRWLMGAPDSCLYRLQRESDVNPIIKKIMVFLYLSFDAKHLSLNPTTTFSLNNYTFLEHISSENIVLRQNKSKMIEISYRSAMQSRQMSIKKKNTPTFFDFYIAKQAF